MATPPSARRAGRCLRVRLRARLPLSTLCFVSLLACLGGSSTSTRGQIAPTAGDLGIFANVDRLDTFVWVTPFAPFDVYGVVFDPPGGMNGFEFAIHSSADFVVVDRERLVGSPIIIQPPIVDGWIVGLGEACLEGPKIALVRERLLPLSTQIVDELICLGPSSPSSVPGTPSFLSCDDIVSPLGLYPDGQGVYPEGCLVVNPSQCGPTSGQFLVMEDALGPPGGTVDLIIGLERRLLTKRCTIVPARIIGYSLELQWDSGTASFVTATVGELTTNWEMVIETLGPGHVRLAAQSSDPDSDWIEDGRGQSIAIVELLLSPNAGLTIVQTSAASLTDAIVTNRAVGEASAVVTVQPIVVDVLSFGALKARY